MDLTHITGVPINTQTTALIGTSSVTIALDTIDTTITLCGYRTRGDTKTIANFTVGSTEIERVPVCLTLGAIAGIV
tara:strand:+ start:3746 stop:3973 length:228 start_codon:yes stop_codon:yes gene_type:complete